jgi:glycosyltransferase involved in cell wall biosynthesis
MVHPPGALAARTLGLPHLWWVHEFGDRDHGFRFLLGQRGTVRAVAALSRAILVPSQAVADHVAAVVGPAKLRTVPGAVDVAAGPAPAPLRPDGPLRLLVAGRVRPSKGQQDAVAAVAELVRGGVDATLDVVGDGELDGLRALAERLGVAGRVWHRRRPRRAAGRLRRS